MAAPEPLADVLARARACTLCAPFLPRPPRPVMRAGAGTRILIIGQAPGTKVDESGIPWDDPSGARLRDWTGLPPEIFYDEQRVALVPMGFCYPGKGTSGDLPPRPECATLWHPPILAALPDLRLTLLVGQYAQWRYLPAMARLTMTERVGRFADMPTGRLALPHPSWRSAGWLKRNPWFEIEALPVLRAAVAAALA